jgi:rfaE bifunctional protein nucleotidyltransferase chain/domain
MIPGVPKMRSQDSLLEWVQAERRGGAKIGFTCGAFDILHAGHVEYLSQARRLCDRLVVAVNCDERVRAQKGPGRPINPEQQRMSVVAALECVDAVVLLEDPRPIRLIELLRPDLYIKGGDYEPARLRSADFVRSYGGQVVVVPITTDSSTTAIIHRITQISLYQAGPDPAREDPNSLVLLDRDGTLIRGEPFPNDPARVQLLPGVIGSLQALQRAGFRLAIVTNQQGIGLGYITREEFIAVNQAMLARLGSSGIYISRIYYCPHSLAAKCACRKPGAYLYESALRDFDVAPGNCYVIGDNETDVGGAKQLGCRTVLLAGAPAAAADFTAADIEQACRWILHQS